MCHRATGHKFKIKGREGKEGGRDGEGKKDKTNRGRGRDGEGEEDRMNRGRGRPEWF